MSIRYRDFDIRPSLVSYHPATDWSFTHKDYDLDDDRHGHAGSIAECKAEIDEWWADTLHDLPHNAAEGEC